MNVTSRNIRLWYLSGGMTKFGIEEYDKSNEWREYLKKTIFEISDGNIVCCNPNDHYNLATDKAEYTDREAMNLDIHKLRNSELVIYNNNDPYSRGSMIELGIAWERRIPIITINDDHTQIHSWVKDMSERIVENTEELIWYVQDHYINID